MKEIYMSENQNKNIPHFVGNSHRNFLNFGACGCERIQCFLGWDGAGTVNFEILDIKKSQEMA